MSYWIFRVRSDIFVEELSNDEEIFVMFWYFCQIEFRYENGTLKNLDMFKHNHSCVKYAIGCYVLDGTNFGFNDILIYDKWDEHFFSCNFRIKLLVIFSSKKQMFLLVTLQNFTTCHFFTVQREWTENEKIVGRILSFWGGWFWNVLYLFNYWVFQL